MDGGRYILLPNLKVKLRISPFNSFTGGGDEETLDFDYDFNLPIIKF